MVYTAPKKKGTPSLNNKTQPSKLTQSQLHKGGAIITGSKHVVPVSESSDRSKNKRFVSGLGNHKAMAWTQGPNQINRLQEPRCQIPPISRSARRQGRPMSERKEEAPDHSDWECSCVGGSGAKRPLSAAGWEVETREEIEVETKIGRVEREAL